MILFSTTSYGQVGLKGFVIGDKFHSYLIKEDLFRDDLLMFRIEESLGGHDGRIKLVLSKEDSTIIHITWFSYYPRSINLVENDPPGRQKYIVEVLKDGLENKFNIQKWDKTTQKDEFLKVDETTHEANFMKNGEKYFVKIRYHEGGLVHLYLSGRRWNKYLAESREKNLQKQRDDF